MGTTSNYLPNGSTIIPAISLSDTNQKIQSLQGDGTYKWVHNANTPVSATESLIWRTDGSVDIMVLNGVFNVRNFGAKGDGVTDDTAAIQAAIDALPNTFIESGAVQRAGGTLFFPQGDYLVSSTLDFSAKSAFSVIGSPRGQGANNTGTSIRSTATVGPIININPSASLGNPSFIFRDIRVRATATAGAVDVVLVNRTIMSSFENFSVDTGNGNTGWAIKLPTIGSGQNFSTSFRNVKLTGGGNTCNGLFVGDGYAYINGIEATGFDTGVRLDGSGNYLMGARIEVNKVGLSLGRTLTNTNGSMSSSFISSATFEANDTALLIGGIASSTINGLSLTDSTTPAPNGGDAQYGLRILGGASGVTISGVNTSGKFQNAAVSVEVAVTAVTWSGNTITNSFGTNPKTWDFPGGLFGHHFINTNFVPRPGNATVERQDYLRTPVLMGLQQLDHTNNNPGTAKNIRGKAVAVAATTTGMTLTFPNAVSAGSISISTATATTAVTASLALGTYFYQLTRVSERGEISAASASAATVTVSGTQNVVNFTVASGPTTYNWKHRLYRGTAFTVYDGYYEWANQTRAFVDVGATFDGTKSPPLGDEFNMDEPDANYAVFAQTNWGTLVVATSKLTTGFSLIFNTTSPATTGTVDWLLVR